MSYVSPLKLAALFLAFCFPIATAALGQDVLQSSKVAGLLLLASMSSAWLASFVVVFSLARAAHSQFGEVGAVFRAVQNNAYIWFGLCVWLPQVLLNLVLIQNSKSASIALAQTLIWASATAIIAELAVLLFMANPKRAVWITSALGFACLLALIGFIFLLPAAFAGLLHMTKLVNLSRPLAVVLGVCAVPLLLGAIATTIRYIGVSAYLLDKSND